MGLYNEWRETKEISDFKKVVTERSEGDAISQGKARHIANELGWMAHELGRLAFIYPELVPLERHIAAYSIEADLIKFRMNKRNEAEQQRSKDSNIE